MEPTAENDARLTITFREDARGDWRAVEVTHEGGPIGWDDDPRALPTGNVIALARAWNEHLDSVLSSAKG